MNRLHFAFLSVCLFAVSGCDVVFGLEPGQLQPTFEVSGIITENTTWSPERTPKLVDFVRVAKDVTLTIEPGTTVLGINDAGLFIDRGARIVAKGTREKPIVFTSGSNPRVPNDWRGLYLCGRAPINGAPAGNFTLNSIPDKLGLTCGGDVVDDSSGELHYVRIEFAGDDDNDGTNRAAGLELAGVGSGTQIDHIQVHLAEKDAVAIYGGTVDLKYMLATNQGDDAFDWAYGWQGRAQFIVSIAQDSDGGIEAGDSITDAFQEAASTATSNPTIYNATFIGAPSKSDTGIFFQDSTRGKLANVLVADYGRRCLQVDDDDTNTKAQIDAGALDMTHSIFACAQNFPETNAFMPIWLESMWLADTAKANQFLMPGMHGIRSLSIGDELDLSLSDGAPGLMGAAMLPADGFFDPSATFIGACGTTCDEFKGWTAFPLQ